LLEMRFAFVDDFDEFASDDGFLVDSDERKALDASTALTLEYFRLTLAIVAGFFLSRFRCGFIFFAIRFLAAFERNQLFTIAGKADLDAGDFFVFFQLEFV